MTHPRPFELLQHLILREKLCDLFVVRPLDDSAFELTSGLGSALQSTGPQPPDERRLGRALLRLLALIRACKIVRITQTQLLAALDSEPAAFPAGSVDRTALPRRLLRAGGSAGLTADLIYALMIGVRPEDWRNSIQWRLLPAGVTFELLQEAQEFARWQLLLSETHATQPLLVLAYALPRSRQSARNVLELLTAWGRDLTQNPQVPAADESTFRQVLTLAAASCLSRWAAAPSPAPTA